MTRPARALLAALLVPPAVAAAVVPFRADVANTNVALVLVLAVVAVATIGDRYAGVVAALSAGLWFDVLLTRPYGTPEIADRSDAETTLLLLAVGVAVTELAAWGRRQHRRAGELDAWARGIGDAVAAVHEGDPAFVTGVGDQVARLLQASGCRFDPGEADPRGPALRANGDVVVDGAPCDVERYGLPISRPIDVPLSSGGRSLGRFVVTAVESSRPSLAERLAAVTLAGRAAEALDQQGRGPAVVI